MAAPTGLYGHVQSNHSRSLLLFGMFLVAFQLLAAVTLWIPLLLFDPAHDPVYNFLPYVRRYVPLLSLLSFILFAAQMWWFVGAVRRRTNFHYVDSREEPRLCRILEPLAIAVGIRTPYAAVIESASLNAFAAGTRQNHMVVVVTRGLIDGLDDDELAAVLANAVIHIRNRDTRLLAAASVFMHNMTLLQKQPGLKFDHPLQVVALVTLPVFLPVMLILGFFIQLCFRIAYGSRALIGIARELIADAEAVRLTHNPAALVSALGKVDRGHVDGELGDENDAMLFVGVTHGPLATHPTLEERVGALARTTGSMVLETAPRLDTRPPEKRRAVGFGRRLDPSVERIAALAEEPERRGLWGAFRSVRDPDRNIVGLTRKGSWLTAISLVAIVLLYQNTLRQPGGVATVFDVGLVRNISGAGTVMVKCTVGGIFDPSRERSEWCEAEGAKANQMFDKISIPGSQRREFLTNRERAERDAKHQASLGCFDGRWDGFDQSSSAYGIKLETYLGFGAGGPARLTAPPGPELDKQLVDYAQTRLLLIDNSLHFFGEGGLASFNRAVDNVDNQVAIRLLAKRLQDPAFTKTLEPGDRVELEMLVAKPLALRPCWANTPRVSRN